MHTRITAAALTVKELASNLFVQRALQSPMQPESVLSFFFGVDVATDDGKHSLQHDSARLMNEMKPLWFGAGGLEYDTLCQHFCQAARAAGTRTLVPSSSWNDSLDGLTAQIVLIDQISRNIFRGSEEAFRCEDVSLGIARQLTAKLLEKGKKNNAEDGIDGEICAPYMSMMVMALMHSECLQDHVTCLELPERAKEISPSDLQGWWNEQQEFEMNHKKVIDRFGRYPHRNRVKKRESTDEERIWLADTENLPGWAKSQG